MKALVSARRYRSEMCHDQRQSTQLPGMKQHGLAVRQQGAGLPLAIFLITVMALIAVTLAQLQQTTGEMEAQDIQSGRAFYAAESGAQLALTQVVPKDPDIGIDTATCPESGTTVYNEAFSEGSLSSCDASVECECDSIDSDDPGECAVATLSSVGSCGSGLDSAQRAIEVRAQ